MVSTTGDDASLTARDEDERAGGHDQRPEDEPPRGLRGMRSQLLVVGLIALVVVLIGLNAADHDASAGASASASAEPLGADATPPPRPEGKTMIPSGYAPVSQFGAELIPWDQVGPGWFLVAYGKQDAPADADKFTAETTGAADVTNSFAPISGGLSLVSPAGDWFAVNSVEAFGLGRPLEWDGSNLWMVRSTSAEAASPTQSAELLDLMTLEPQGSVEAIPSGTLDPVRPGASLVYTASEDAAAGSIVVGDLNGAGGCSAAGTGYYGWQLDDMGYQFSAADGGRLVCFAPLDEGEGANVVVVHVDDVAASEVVAQVRWNPENNLVVGWVDETHALIADSVTAGGRSDQVRLLNIESGAMTDAAQTPFWNIVPGQDTSFFDQVTQHYITTRVPGDTWAMLIETLDETREVATVSGACPGGRAELDQQVSGGRLMVMCGSTGSLRLIDLATGKSLGRWELGIDAFIDVFDHPDT